METTSPILYHAEVEGRTYEVEVFPHLMNEPFGLAVRIYRWRKDEKRGARLSSIHKAAWKAWTQVREIALADIAKAKGAL